MTEPIVTVGDTKYERKLTEQIRTLPVVTPEQFAALHLFAHHYEVLGVLLTMPSERITELLARGYQTNDEKGTIV